MNTVQRIRITEPGWGNFNGNFGGVNFVEALSVEPVTPQQAAHLGSLVRIEAVDDSAQISASTILLNSMDAAAPVVEPMQTVDEPARATAPAVATLTYTREQLEKIADDDGIAGLRKIADKHGIRGRGIQELITEILAKVPKAE